MILHSSLVQRPRLTQKVFWLLTPPSGSHVTQEFRPHSYCQEFTLGWLHNLNLSVCAAEVSTTPQFLVKTNSWEKLVEETLNKRDSETVLTSRLIQKDGQLNIIISQGEVPSVILQFHIRCRPGCDRGTMRSLPRCVLSLFWASFKWSASSSFCFSIQPDLLVPDFHMSLAPSSLSKFSPILNRYKYPHHKPNSLNSQIFMLSPSLPLCPKHTELLQVPKHASVPLPTSFHVLRLFLGRLSSPPWPRPSLTHANSFFQNSPKASPPPMSYLIQSLPITHQSGPFHTVSPRYSVFSSEL